MEDKQYDLLLSLVDNGGNASIVDLVDKGMTTDNTSFYDKDTYKNSEVIKEKFTNPTTGEFDDKLFDNVYASAEAQYQKLGILQDVKKADNLFKDNGYLNDAWLKITDNNAYQLSKLGEDRTLTSEYISIPNPDLVNKSLAERLNYTAESPWSVRELAQMNKVKDSMTGEWMDTPSFFGVEPLVLATYDEEVKDENGNVIHEKGEKKLDEDGHYYYETLGNRSVYGKELLNRWDVVTPDNSLLNKIDFFDSDDKYSKNPIGAVLKTAALVGSMYIPGVGPWIAGLSVLMQTSSMLGTLGKMITGDETSYTLNNLEAFAKQYARDSKTDEAQQSIFSFENIIGLIGEVAAQLKEQRWIFEQTPLLLGKEARLGQEYMLSKEPMKVIDKTSDLIFKERFNKEFAEGVSKLKTGNLEDFKKYISATEMAQKDIVKKFLEEQVKKNTQFSANLSKAYMTFLTTQDAYGEAIHMGIPRYEALGYAAGYTLAEYALLNTEIGERILPELHADRVMMKGMLNTIFKETKETLTKNKALYPEDFIGKKAFSSIFKTAQEKSRKVLDTLLPSYYTNEGVANLGKILWGNAVGEMLEETSEELLADLSKEALTLYRQFQNEDHINMWQNDNWVERYFMSALGGFLGGGMNTALTHASQGFEAIKKFGVFEGTANDAILSIAQDPEQIELMNKVLDQLPIGNSTVSFEFNDRTKQFETTGDYTQSQDYIIKESLKNLINYTAKQLKADGAYLSKESFLNAMTEVGRNAFTEAVNLSNLRNTKTLGVQFSHFRELQNRLMNLNADIDDIYNSKPVDSAKLKEDQKLRLQQLTEEKEKVIAELQSYANKEKIYDFAETALFESNEELSKAFKKKNFLNLGHYTEWRFGMDYAKTTQNQKDRAKAEWEAFQDEENPEFILACSDIFKKILKDNQKNIQEALNKPAPQGNETQFESLLNTLSKLNNEFNIDELEKYSDGVNETLNTIFNQIKKANELKTSLETIGFISFFKNYPGDKIQFLKNIFNELNNQNPDQTQYYIDDNNQIHRTKDNTDEIIQTQIFDEEGNTLDIPLTVADFANKYTTLQGIEGINPDTDFANWKKITPDLVSSIILEQETGFPSVELIQKDSLNKILQDIKNFQSFNPVHYAYAESVLNQLKTNNDEDTKLVKETLEILANKRKSISFDLLENFIDKTNSSNNKVNEILKTLNLIHSYITTNHNYDFSKLKLSKEELNSLKILNSDIELLQSLLNAMRNDNADITNIKGYTPLLNNINKALNLGKEPLVEINKDQVDILTQDLQSFSKFINNYLEIDELNAGAKFKEEISKQVKDITGTISFMYDNLGDTALGDKEKLKTLCPTIFDLIEKIKKANDDRIYDVPTEILKILIKEKIALEKHIYDTLNSDLYFDKNLKTFKKEAFKNLIIKCLPDNWKDFDSNKINVTISKDKSWQLFLSYLLRIGSFESSLFYNAYREYLKNNSDLAALYEQEINVHTAISTLVNSKFINDACDIINEACVEQYNKLLPEKLQDLKTKKAWKTFFGYKNTVTIQGFPGAGKTAACIKQILTILQQSNPNLIKSLDYAHVTKENADKVIENYKKFSIQTYSKESLLTKFYNDYANYQVEGILTPENQNTLFGDNLPELKDNIKPNIITNCPKIIFLDEFSKYTEIDLRLLERAALVNGFIVIGIGDFAQISSTCETQDGKTLTSLISQFYCSEKLSTVVRAENNLIEIALNEFQKISFIDELKDFKGFTYYEDESSFVGIKYASTNNLKQSFDELIKKRKENETIMLVVDNPEAKEIKTLKAGYPNVEAYTLQECQGNEAHYVLDAVTYKSTNSKEIYTVFSRAKIGAILSHTQTNYTKVDHYTKFTSLSEAFIQKTNQARIDQYSNLENQNILSQEHFQPIYKDESLKGTTQTPPLEKNSEEFDSEEEAKNYLNSFNLEQTWRNINDNNDVITTSVDNFKIVPDNDKYIIKVEVNTKNWNFENFIKEYEPVDEPPVNEPSSQTHIDEISKDPSAPGSNLQFYGFNTNYPFPTQYNSNSKRIDNYYGLIKLNNNYQSNKQLAEQILQKVQNYLYRKLLLNQSINVGDIDNIIKGSSNLKQTTKKLEVGIIHPSKANNSVWSRDPEVVNQTATGNIQAPGSHIVFRFKDDNNILFEVNLGSLINPLTLIKTYKNHPFIQRLIGKFSELNPDNINQEKLNTIRKDDYYKFLQSEINSSTNASEKNFITQLAALSRIFTNSRSYYNLKEISNNSNNQNLFDLQLELVSNFREADYQQSATSKQYQSIIRNLKEYLPSATQEDGIYVDNRVYIAKYDIKQDNKVLIPKGTSFILYSFDENVQHTLDNLIKNRGVYWYGITEKPNNDIGAYLNYLNQKYSNQSVTQHWGNNATSYYLVKYIFEKINYNTNHILFQNLKRHLKESAINQSIDINAAFNQFIQFSKLLNNRIKKLRNNAAPNKYTSEVIQLLTNTIGNQGYFTLINSGASRFYTIFNETLLNLLTPNTENLSQDEINALNEEINKIKSSINQAFENKELPDIIPQAPVQAISTYSNILQSNLPLNMYEIKGHLQRPIFNSPTLKDALNNLLDLTTMQIKALDTSTVQTQTLTDAEKIQKAKSLFNNLKSLDKTELPEDLYLKLYKIKYENNNTRNKNNSLNDNVLKELADNKYLFYKFNNDYYVQILGQQDKITAIEITNNLIKSYTLNNKDKIDMEYNQDHIIQCSYNEKKTLTKSQEILFLEISDSPLKLKYVQLKKDITKEFDEKNFELIKNLNSTNISEGLKIIKKLGSINYYYIFNENNVNLNDRIFEYVEDNFKSSNTSFNINKNIYKKDSLGNDFTPQEIKDLQQKNQVDVYEKHCSQIII